MHSNKWDIDFEFAKLLGTTNSNHLLDEIANIYYSR